MADFSDAEDKQLVQIALKHEMAGTRISWMEVAQQMKKWKNNKEKLRLRLKTLKDRFGPNICDFPERLLNETPRKRTRNRRASIVKISTAVSTTDTSAVQVLRTPVTDHHPTQDAIAVETCSAPADALYDRMSDQELAFTRSNESQPERSSTGHTSNLLLLFNAILDGDSHRPTPSSTDATSRLCVAAAMLDEPVVEESACYKIVENMFQSISRAAVRQESGRPEQNMGEVCMASVTSLLQALRLEVTDVFLDVGAGIGNVVAQVALQSRACRVVGIEMREGAVSLAKRAIASATPHYPQLLKISLLHGDIRAPDTIKHRSVQESTVLYCFSTVFDESSKVTLERLTCELNRLRLVVVADKFCPRHERRKKCVNEFCTMWAMHKEVQMSVTYNCKQVSFSIYKRKQS